MDQDFGGGRVAVTLRDGVVEVRLNRPDKLNALDRAMFSGLVEAGEGLAFCDREVAATGDRGRA